MQTFLMVKDQLYRNSTIRYIVWTLTLRYIFSAISTLMFLNTIRANKLVNLLTCSFPLDYYKQ